MKKNKFSKIPIIFILLVIVLITIYFKYGEDLFKQRGDVPVLSVDFTKFSKADKANWYAGEWDTHQEAWDFVFLDEDGIRLRALKADKVPYLLSKPIKIDVDKNYIISIKRRVKIKPADVFYAGALVLFQDDSPDLKPKISKNQLFGDALFQIEYAANTPQNSTRPGGDVFRILVPEWEKGELYRTLDPIYGKWFDEEIIYNTKQGKLIYRVKSDSDTHEAVTELYKISKDYIRVWMHSYGAYTGHEMQISNFEMSIEQVR